MDSASSKSASNQSLSLYLLTIRGVLAPATLEGARGVHNQTAGAPANVTAAQSLGDLSHMVYVPAAPTASGAGEFLILDIWNSMDGLNQFFANPHVQEQAGEIFSQRDPVVWVPADGYIDYHLPAPASRTDRILVVVRGRVSSWDDALATHNALVSQAMTATRRAGGLSHEAYMRLAPPGSPESLEFLALDVWTSAPGMGEFMQNPEVMSGFMHLFTAPPVVSAWVHPGGEWVEW